MHQNYAELCNDLRTICELQISNNNCWFSFFCNKSDYYRKILNKTAVLESKNNMGDSEKLLKMRQYLLEVYCGNKEIYSDLKPIMNKLLSIKKTEWDNYYKELNDYSDIFLSTQVHMNSGLILSATDIASVMRLHDPIENRYHNANNYNKSHGLST